MSNSSKQVSTHPPENYRYHFFVSYTTREDEIKIIKPFIDDYLNQLSQRIGFIPVYYDGLYLRGSNYSEDFLVKTLAQAIEESAFTISFLSPGYINSEWCAFEWLATEKFHDSRGYPAQNKSILPIMWKDISNRESKFPELDEYIRKRRWLDISGKIYGNRFYNQEYVEALHECVEETIIYINAWFPKGGWLL